MNDSKATVKRKYSRRKTKSKSNADEPTAEDILIERAKTKIFNCISFCMDDREIMDAVYLNPNSAFKTLSRKTIQKLLAECRKEVLEMAKIDQEYELGQMVLQYNTLYKDMYFARDFRGCAILLLQKSKLYGLGEINTVKQTGEMAIIHKYEEVGDRTDVKLPESDTEVVPPIRLT